MSDKHQATFTWPAGPSKVEIKGSWDNWSERTELNKTDSGFSKTLDVSWDSKITYKYIVDGQWKADPSIPQEYDGRGNLNNVYTSPPKPTTAAPPASVPSVPVATKVEEAKSTAAEVVDSATATAGTTSILSYVTSGVGAAIATVTGYDPVNPQQILVENTPTPTPVTTTAAPIPEPEPTKDEPVVLPVDSAEKTTEEAKAVPIPNAPEPYKETNGTLPAELESPTTDATSTSHPTEGTTTTTTTAVEPVAKETTPTKKRSETPPRTSNGSPPTTPKKFSFSSPRRSGSITGSSIQTDTTSPNGKRKKRDSIFGKIKEVFHHSPKKEKASP